MEQRVNSKGFSLPPIDNHRNLNDDSVISAPEMKPSRMNNDPNQKLEIINEETKNYIEEMKRGSYNILVAVRCRPLNKREKELSNSETVKIMDDKMVILLDPIEYNGPNNIFKNRSREQTLAFDFAFDKFSTQKKIFENTTKFLLEGVVNGYNATVFAYGATGAGKTYTMLGNDDNPGIMPLTLSELFNKVKQYSNEREYKLKLWYLEIYNENIRDLLANNSDEYLDLREDPTKGIIVSGITELNVTSCNDILKILKRGNKNRTQEATGANETSSRSHAILQVSVEYKTKNTGIEVEIRYGKLSLIDLAGSERASATQNRGIRLIEGANINRSLLTLGNCINALCDANIKGTKPYVPYRDSKLTRLLKDSLGGNARTVMIANISPSINTFDDTYNTLKYANRAKNIKTYVQRNVLNAQYHISNYVNIINKIKAEKTELKTRLGDKVGIPQNIEQKRTNINVVQSEPYKNDNNLNFQKTYEEIKNICLKQIQLKKGILSQQNEYNKTMEQLNNVNSISNQNNENINDISHYSNNYENNNNLNDLSSIPQNLNRTEIIDNQAVNLQEKLSQLNISMTNAQDRINEYSKLTERMLLNQNYSNPNEKYQDEYLKNIVNGTKSQIHYLETLHQSNLLRAQNDIKNEYIAILENQIKLRDDYFVEKNINIYSNPHIKNLAELRQDNKKKVPFIKNNINSYTALTTRANYNRNLPPISKRLYQNKENYPLNSNYAYHRFNNYKINRSPNQNKTNPHSKNHKVSLVRNYSQNFKNHRAHNSPGEIETPVKKGNPNNHYRYHSNGTNSTSNIYNYNKKCASSKGSRKNINSAIRLNSNNNKGNKINPNKQTNITQVNYVDNSIVEIDNSNEGDTLKKVLNNKQILGTDSNNPPNSVRLTTINQMIPQVKKSELNNLLNEKNKKRQQLLDKINNIKQDCL